LLGGKKVHPRRQNPGYAYEHGGLHRKHCLFEKLRLWKLDDEYENLPQESKYVDVFHVDSAHAYRK